ncbi:MAG: alpha/beta hydrolase [Sphingomonas fennica]
MRRLALALLLAGAAADARPLGGTLPSGAKWQAEVPDNWNGTLLLWSRGYRPQVPATIDLAPKDTAAPLLARGYALAATGYARGGWAVEEGEADGIATLDAFAAAAGAPKRTIAWGSSMGGLVTTALVERHPARIDGAAPGCASIGGTPGMMNMALDGAFAFKTLLAPDDAALRLTGIPDDRANGAAAQAILDRAQQTPAGRARIALAGVLAGIPGWTDPAAPRPADRDHAAQHAQIARSFVMGVFLPRQDSEARAGGNFSWNEGVDYTRQLALSGRSKLVRTLYAEAGLSLAADLRALARAPRIAARPAAVTYMRDHYAPTGRTTRPVLSYQAIGDGATSPTMQRGYAEAAQAAGRAKLVRLAWVNGAGHCTFTAPEHVAIVETLADRIATGRWRAAPADLDARVAAAGGTPRFIAYRPTPPLRPCTGEKTCR